MAKMTSRARKCSWFGVFFLSLVPAISPVMAQEIGSDVTFNADRIVMTESDYNVVATGSVKLANEDLKLNADKLVLEFDEPKEGSDELIFNNATAEGNIWGEASGVQITADHARYDNGSQQAVFWGNAVVTQEGNRVSANEVRINVETGVYELVGGVQGRIRGSF